jgi:hypothetical protein
MALFFCCRRCNAARAELFSLMSSQKVVDVSRTQGGARNSNLKVRLVFFVDDLAIVGFSSQSSVPRHLTVSLGMLSGSVGPHSFELLIECGSG